MKKEALKFNAFIFLFLLLVSPFAIADGWSSGKPSHQTVYADTLTSKADASPVTVADGQGLYITGNVGIGTVGQLNGLHLGDGKAHISLGTNKDFEFFISGADGIIDYGTGINKIKFQQSGTDIMAMDSSGSVGIGTASPGSKLDLRNGNMDFTDVDVAHGATSLLPTNVFTRLAPESGTAGGLRITGGTETDIAINLNGFSGAPSTDGNGAVIRIRAVKISGTGETSLANNEDILTVGNAGTEVFFIKGSGNVGIGTTDPKAKLHIEGDIRKSQGGAVTSEFQGTKDIGDNVATKIATLSNIDDNTRNAVIIELTLSADSSYSVKHERHVFAYHKYSSLATRTTPVRVDYRTLSSSNDPIDNNIADVTVSASINNNDVEIYVRADQTGTGGDSIIADYRIIVTGNKAPTFTPS